jgi:threonine dehydrogenase-like Zn-dependent dehydrogenase
MATNKAQPRTYRRQSTINSRQNLLPGRGMLTVLALAMCRPLRAPQGRQEVYAIDTVPHRLALASKSSSKVEVVDFQQVDVKKHIHQKEPQGLDGGLTVPFYRSHLGCCRREGQGACLAF